MPSVGLSGAAPRPEMKELLWAASWFHWHASVVPRLGHHVPLVLLTALPLLLAWHAFRGDLAFLVGLAAPRSTPLHSVWLSYVVGKTAAEVRLDLRSGVSPRSLVRVIGPLALVGLGAAVTGYRRLLRYSLAALAVEQAAGAGFSWSAVLQRTSRRTRQRLSSGYTWMAMGMLGLRGGTGVLVLLALCELLLVVVV